MASSKQARMLLRQLLRCGKQIQDDLFTLQPPVAGAQWGTHDLLSSADPLGWHDHHHHGEAEHLGAADQDSAVLEQLVPGLAVQPSEPVVSRQAYRQLVLGNFRASAREQDPQAVSDRLDEAFSALRGMAEQLYLQQCSSRCTTDGVQVTVTSSFDKRAHLSGGPGAYVFTYRVRVKNLRQQPIKVLGRGWQIRDEDGLMHYEVPLGSNAVVGQQPILAPGSEFQYHSGTEIATPTGSQAGKLMVAVLGNGQDRTPTMSIVADVGPFALRSTHAKPASAPAKLWPWTQR